MSNEQSHITTVTSETFGDYVDSVLGTQKGPEEIAEAEHEKVIAEREEKKLDEEPAHDLGDHVPEEKKGRLNKRFSEITKARRDAEEKAEKLAREVQDLKGRLDQKKEDPEDNKEPEIDTFRTQEEYRSAMKTWAMKEAKREVEAGQIKARQEEENRQKSKAWQERSSKLKDEIPGFSEEIAARKVPITDEMRDILLDSESGPRIMYYLAENQEQAKRIAGLSVRKMLVEIGRLEARFSKSESKEDEQDVRKGRPPLSTVSTGAVGSSTSKVDKYGEFTGTFEEYKELRRSGKIK